MTPGASVPETPELFRSLAEDLRSRTDEQLAALIVARPDLARPAPADLVALAARASSRPSVQRAIERADRAMVHALQAVVIAGETHPVGAAAPHEVAQLLGADDPSLQDVLTRLRDVALIWSSAEGIHPVRSVAEVLGPNPGGLGVRAAEIPDRYAASSPPSAAELADLLSTAPAAARAIVERLTWGPPVGAVPPSGTSRDGAIWLVEHGFVAPTGLGHVTLVREVALELRGGRLYPRTALAPPVLQLRAVEQVTAERVAGTHARELLDQIEQLGMLWSQSPARVLRSGGIGVRELAALARTLDTDAPQAAFVAEAALGAGLIADDGEIAPAWVPTSEFDAWQARPASHRWVDVLTSWMASPRAVHLSANGDRAATTPSPLGPELHWPPIRSLRADVLAELAGLPAGSAPTPESVGEAIAWRRPLGDDQSIAVGVAAVMQQAEWLGLTGLGALTSVGGALAEGADPDTLRSAADALLPAAVDHVLLQADLTAIAPGPLDGPLGRLMRLVSDVESRGGATVLRFSAPTVRRALDAGMTADDILGQLAAASRTPIPQPLDYLVRDIARRHGQTRVGGATAYVRSDDEAVLAALVADRSLSSELLRRIAPTVVVSQADPVTLLEKLRAAGYAPAREALDGSLVVSAPQGRRARDSRRRPAARGIPDPTLRLVDLEFARSVVAALRCAPPRPAASSTPSGPLSNPPGESANLLRHAIADAFPVWVGYADGNGRTARHLVRPVRIEGGRVYAVSGESDAEQVFLLHRITGAQPG